jgi:1L-myo-inositol 1-phosphate cytidylyltransferase / CDP-L-myo-inositol myo-inositolphosphotransferase
VIVAAGRGSRMLERPLPKPLTPLLGLALIERVLLTARNVGIERFVVVTGYQRETTEAFLADLAARRGLELETVANPSWELDNGQSVLAARPHVDEPFLLLMADHLYQPELLHALLQGALGEDEVVLAADSDIEANPFVDLADVTRVRLSGERITDIGKQLEVFEAFDTGAFLCSPSFFERLEDGRTLGDTTLSAGVRAAATAGRARVRFVAPRCWIDVDDQVQLNKAETFLLGSLGKSTDGPVSRRLNRPVSLRISRVLAARGVSPNAVSLASFGLALAAAACFLLPGYAWLVAGGILVHLSSVLDGSDGEVARLTYRTTEFGGRLDQVLDRYADAFILLALTYRVAGTPPEWLPLAVGVLALVGSFMSSYTASWYDPFAARKAGDGPRAPRVGRDVRLLLLALGALANVPLLALAAVGLVMNLETVRRLVVLARER